MAEIVEMDAVKLVQKGLPMYVGKMKASNLLELSDIENWSEQTLDGYQRERFREKTREIAQYLDECSIAMIPALLASFREGEFVQVRGDFGVLKIPRKMGAIWLIDGQQRTGGFNEIWSELQELQRRRKTLEGRTRGFGKIYRLNELRGTHGFRRCKRNGKTSEKRSS